jgi:hypothetical protein
VLTPRIDRFFSSPILSDSQINRNMGEQLNVRAHGKTNLR